MALVAPFALASGCLLVAPPEDMPAPVPSGQGAQADGGSAGRPSDATGGIGAGNMTAGGQAGEPINPEGSGPETGGNAGSGGTGAFGPGARGGTGGGGGTRARGGAGGGVEPQGGAGEGGAFECTTNEECTKAAAYEPSRCRPSDHSCVALKSNECPLVYGGVTDPNALYLGSFAVLNPDNPADSDVYLAEQFAVQEINAAGGLPGGPNGATRPLVLITCTNDGVAVPNAVSLAMSHLAEEVQVPALIAMLAPDDLTSAFLPEAEKQPDKQLFFLNPGATLRRLTDPGTTQGLLWTLLGQPSDYAPAYHLLASDLEKQVRSERSLTPGDSIKVALVTTTDAFDKDLRTYVFQSLVFNGDSAANEGGNYREYTLDATSPAIADTVGDILDFAPDIVISTAGDAMTAPSGVLAGVESGWTSDKPRPYYLLSPYNATTDANATIGSVIYGELDAEPTAARRFLGVNAAPAEDLTLQNDYAIRYKKAFPGEPASAGTNTDNYYDAVYYLAYALYGASSPTGPGIADGMKRLITGDALDDGPADIGNVFTALGAGSTLSLQSTLGPPDFDATTGVRAVTPGVFCYQYDQGIFTPWANTLRYDAATDSFTGPYPCLTGFPPQ